MNCTSTRISYSQTGHFNKIVVDYIGRAPALQPFISHSADLAGLEAAIRQRRQFSNHRRLLADHFKKQYEGQTLHPAVSNNIDRLLSETTFTITTAHQNNIFTGPLYFIYKILHAIRVAADAKAALPAYDFVPVYYMGSEDADLAELNHIHLNNERLTWDTKQKGAVGRMKIDAALLQLIDRIEGEIGVLPFGKEMAALLRRFYVPGRDMQTATFLLVNALFESYGLLVLIADDASLKGTMSKLFEDELLQQTASALVEKTAASLSDANYKVQAHPREINLFYLEDDVRERIIRDGDNYVVNNTGLSFSKDEMLQLIKDHPERFSPNVILRGLYQETILPNIAFIGGGGEIAYWLQLKTLFEHYGVPYPLLLIRNSFLIVEKKWQEKIKRLGFSPEDFFLPELELVNRLVQRDSEHSTQLNGSLPKMKELYDAVFMQAAAIDSTLGPHVEALRNRSLERLRQLEKKMLRAEKRKFATQQKQIHDIKSRLFPGNGLQERYDNLSYFYAIWGSDLISQLYAHSPALEQEMVLLLEA